MGLVLLVVIGVWLLNGRDPGGPTSGAFPESASSRSAEAMPTRPADPAPRSTPSSPTPTRSTPAIDPESGLPLIELADLPREATDVIDLIFVGGPYAYDKDGSTFGNYEGLLPDEPRGYYAEYTVDTPGSDDRGARRIVTGDGGEFYWTADHYASFARIVV